MKNKLKLWLYYILMLVGIIGVMDSVIAPLYIGINVGTVFPGAAGDRIFRKAS